MLYFLFVFAYNTSNYEQKGVEGDCPQQDMTGKMVVD